ncbi:MAG TPA: hypothetical protein VJS88_08200 [Chthoniobacterales bacterium]|nr:hypothetical protein [Chthoniobacterales bacterium]
MVAASIFDHPAVLLLIAAIGLVRWLVQKAKEGQRDVPPPPPAEPIQRGAETQTEEERIRRFLEALGQPKGTAPPKVVPKIVPRPQPFRPRIFPNLPPLTTVPPVLPQSAPPPPPPPLPIERPVFTPISRTVPTFEVQDVARQSGPAPEKRRAVSALPFKARLNSIQDLRSAIVLREIFGPPRSLQPLDLTSGSHAP